VKGTFISLIIENCGAAGALISDHHEGDSWDAFSELTCTAFPAMPCNRYTGIKGEGLKVLHASTQPDNHSIKLLNIMVDVSFEKMSFLLRQANFVGLGLCLVLYGRLAFLVVGDFSYLRGVGIYTTLIGFLLYYVFGTLSL
jgi:hypothetical protein